MPAQTEDALDLVQREAERLRFFDEAQPLQRGLVVRPIAVGAPYWQFGGISKRICLEYVPEAQIGDYVLVHVGFALARVDEEEAKRIYEMLEAIGGLEELNELDDPPRPQTLWRRVEPSAVS